MMSKEPIDLGLSVEQHVHHNESDHSQGSNINQVSKSRSEDRQFGTDSLSQTEQLLAVVFVGGMLIVFLVIVTSIFINLLND